MNKKKKKKKRLISWAPVTISHPPGGGRGRQQLNQQIRTPVAFSVKKIYNKRKAKETIVNKAGKQRILFVVFI